MWGCYFFLIFAKQNLGMNKILKNVLIFEIVLSLVCYVLSSFIGLSFNPNYWDDELRHATATLWMGTQLLIFIIIDITNNNDNNFNRN